MAYSAVDLCIEIDFGSNEPGAILQYLDRGYWHDYMVKGKPVVNPFDVESLPAGFYRLVEAPLSGKASSRGTDRLSV